MKSPIAQLFLAALLAAGLVTSATALDLTRDDVRTFMREMQRKHGMDEKMLRAALGAAELQPRVIELMTRPAEKVKPWHEYREHFLTEQRIAAGVEFWNTHRDSLATIEADTGVSAHVIVAIIGVETYFGRITGKFRVVDALSTLTFDYPPRSSYFRAELEQFLLLSAEEQVDVGQAQGSYAGAMGAPQFMPRSYRAYAADGDGDGRRDLWGSWPDVLASVANYLVRHGWRRGEPVSVPADLWFPEVRELVAGSLAPNSTVKALRDLGLSFETSLEDKAPALFIGVAGTAGPELRAGFHNFGVITRYNRSVLYALAVDELGLTIAARLPPAASATVP